MLKTDRALRRLHRPDAGELSQPHPRAHAEHWGDSHPGRAQGAPGHADVRGGARRLARAGRRQRREGEKGRDNWGGVL